MLNIKHILVVLDSDHPEQPAFHRALALAGSLKADITILGSCYEAYCEDSSSLEVDTKNEIKSALINNKQMWLDCKTQINYYLRLFLSKRNRMLFKGIFADIVNQL